MTIFRRAIGDRLAGPNNRQTGERLPARQFSIQREIQRLEAELNASNELIAELEGEGHESHAMEVLKAYAIDFARRIDELRCMLIASAPEGTARKQNSWKG